MFDKKIVKETLSEDQNRVDATCTFVESFMAQIAETKTQTLEMKKEMEEKKAHYTTILDRLNAVHDFCDKIEGTIK
jgi:hypothetical protein